RAAAGALALDDVQLARRRVLRLAVGELAGEGRDIHRPFADDLAGLARRLASLRGDDGLLDDLLRRLRVLFEELAELFGDDVLDDALHFARDELLFRLRAERRVRVLDGDDAGQPFADVFALNA